MSDKDLIIILGEALKKAKDLIIILGEALKKAKDHLEYCGYGDSWESECAYNIDLPGMVDSAVEQYEASQVPTPPVTENPVADSESETSFALRQE